MTGAFPILVGLAAAATLEGAFLLVRGLVRRREAELERRLGLLGESAAPPTGLLRRQRYASSSSIEAFVRAIPGSGELESLLAQADAQGSVAQLLASSLAAGLVLFLVLLAAGALAWGAAGLGLVGAAIPIVLVHLARVRRSARLSEQLPDALDMASRSLRAGHALPSALRLVASESPIPAGVEFARACEEQAHGLSVEESVANMTARVPLNHDLKFLVVAVRVQRETGGNLSEILEKLAATIRDRYRFQSKLKALTAEGRASGLVLAALPVGTLLLVSVLRPEYAVRLVDNALGRGIFAFAVTAWVAGLVWMNRMSKVEP